MTTLPERLQDVIVSFRRLAKDHEIKADRPHQDDSTRQWHMGTAEAYDDAADRLEAAQALQSAPEGGEVCIVCDWKDADPFPRFIEAEVGGRSVAFEWRYRNDGLKELVIPTQGETK